GGDERCDVEAGFLDLAEQLVAAVDVSERSDGVRTAHGNDIGSLPFGAQLVGTRLGLGEQITAVAGHGDRIGAEEAEEQAIARVLGWVRPGGAEPDPPRAEILFDDEVALESLSTCRRQRQSAMIGLDAADGDESVRTLLKRIGDEEFEFAGLVPAFSQPQPVIPFDPDLRAAELGGEARQMLQRRRSVDVAATRNLLKVDHGTRVYS